VKLPLDGRGLPLHRSSSDGLDRPLRRPASRYGEESGSSWMVGTPSTERQAYRHRLGRGAADEGAKERDGRFPGGARPSA